MSLSGYSLALIDDGRNQPKTPQINSNFGFWWERKTRMPKGKRTYNIEVEIEARPWARWWRASALLY